MVFIQHIVMTNDPQEARGQLLLVPAGRWKTLGLLLSSSRLSELVRPSSFSKIILSWIEIGRSALVLLYSRTCFVIGMIMKLSVYGAMEETQFHRSHHQAKLPSGL